MGKAEEIDKDTAKSIGEGKATNGILLETTVGTL
jgi:hypothetical protein